MVDLLVSPQCSFSQLLPETWTNCELTVCNPSLSPHLTFFTFSPFLSHLLTFSFGCSHITLAFLFLTHPCCVLSISFGLSFPTALFCLSLSGRDVWGEAGFFASHGLLWWLGHTHCHTACQRMVCVFHPLHLPPKCMALYCGCVTTTVTFCVFNDDHCCQLVLFWLFCLPS